MLLNYFAVAKTGNVWVKIKSNLVNYKVKIVSL